MPRRTCLQGRKNMELVERRRMRGCSMRLSGDAGGVFFSRIGGGVFISFCSGSALALLRQRAFARRVAAVVCCSHPGAMAQELIPVARQRKVKCPLSQFRPSQALRPAASPVRHTDKRILSRNSPYFFSALGKQFHRCLVLSCSVRQNRTFSWLPGDPACWLAWWALVRRAWGSISRSSRHRLRRR